MVAPAEELGAKPEVRRLSPQQQVERELRGTGKKKVYPPHEEQSKASSVIADLLASGWFILRDTLPKTDRSTDTTKKQQRLPYLASRHTCRIVT